MALATDRLVRPVEGMHRTISRRWFDAVGPITAPVRLAHDTIAGTVYTGIRLAGIVVGLGLDRWVDVRDETADRLTGFVTGVLGTDLGRHEAAFGVRMGVRPTGLPPTGRLVVLVHGLTETERVFESDGGLRAAIDAEDGLTAVPVRYHSGLSVAANGRALADLIEDLVAGWPVPVRSIALVGRSMGGLVARAACTTGAEVGHTWVTAATDVITIGTPHRGSYVAKVAAIAARGLRAAPDTRPLADVLDARSPGIRDLHHGSSAGLPGGIEHHFVAGVLAPGPVGALVGDSLVGRRSATGDGLGPTTAVTVPSAAHGSLHRRPEVVSAVMAWLSTDPPGAARRLGP